eukprot:3497006-Ditylum_brightwellii.AAC.1
MLDDVWAIKIEQDINTRKVTKYKARINMYCGQLHYGMNYVDTSASNLTWNFIHDDTCIGNL